MLKKVISWLFVLSAIVMLFSFVPVGEAAEAEQADMAMREFNAAMDRGTIRALDDFINKWRDSPDVADFQEKAASRIKELRADGRLSASILKNSKNATSDMIDDFLRDYPGHKDEKKVRALGERNLLAMIDAGVVSVNVTGNSIQNTTVVLTNKTKRNVTVNIPIGTYFSSNSGSVQNMVVRSSRSEVVQANSSKSISVATACMNIDKDIPGSNNSFGVSSLDSKSRLARVMKLLEERNASYAVTQAAVWLVTDDPGDDALLNTLRNSTGGRAISSSDLAEAKKIVRQSDGK